jgi:ATP-dependent DNA helicase RecG
MTTPTLALPVTSLWGVGPERAKQLERLEIRTIENLLLHRPRRYEDRRNFKPIAQLQAGDAGVTRGKIVAAGVKWFRKRTKSVYEFVLDDGSGRLHCRWWNLPFMEKNFATGDEVVVFGKLLSVKPRTMDHPEYEVVDAGEENFIHLNRFTPIYPLTEGLPQRWLRALIWRTLEKYEAQIEEPWGKGEVRGARGEAGKLHADRSGMPSRAKAIRMLHFPEKDDEPERARRRLALDEFVALQIQMRTRRRNFETKAAALPCGGDNRLMKPFLARLGFKLTEAQTKVLRELRKDMSGAHPMRRLLQGDVGSGKTVVAACCALMALESGYNVAIMAPTEILAEQHFRNFTRWFESLGLGVEMQTGSRKTVQSQKSEDRNQRSEVSAANQRVGRDKPTIFIGTHALLSEGFEIPKLGLVIIDEQHKFGVSQREQLVRKGVYPHLLVMTATPIPRTLGLTLYAELDVSVIEELPPGRGRIQTFVRTADRLPKVWEFIRGKLKEGRQVYVVYPRVEETGQDEFKAVTKEFENLQKILTPSRVGLVHGRMPSKAKEEVMATFRANETNVLLTTALIEVGVDVPNATVMLIENAEQFGLAQLHQLRGRIGRGAHDSYCILVSAAKTKEARERLKVLEATNDAFRIAEADLKLRGPGELLGQQQSGMPRFRFGNLSEDLELIVRAREIVAAELARD